MRIQNVNNHQQAQQQGRYTCSENPNFHKSNCNSNSIFTMNRRKRRRRISKIPLFVLFSLAYSTFSDIRYNINSKNNNSCSSSSSSSGNENHPFLHVQAFGVRKWVSRRVRGGTTTTTSSSSPSIAPSPARFLADKEKASSSSSTSSWSNSAAASSSSSSAASDSRSSSPLKVRKRVKAVLEKARSRTGIENGSSQKKKKANTSQQQQQQQQQQPWNIVADAASIGGIDDDVVIQVNGLEQQSGTTTTSITNTTATKSTTVTSTVFPDEELIIQRTTTTTSADPQSDFNGKTNIDTKSSSPSLNIPISTLKKKNLPELDAIQGDVPAANTFCEPLPFALPQLTPAQIKTLESGERVQEQARMGREGSGYVVVDVEAPPYIIWENLLDFESYSEMIPTVKDMQLYTSEKLNIGYVNEKPVLPGTGRAARHYGKPSVTRASFILSKFRLNIAAVHKYTPHPEGDYMIFTLDRSCTNMVLKGAKGIWHIEENPDGREGVSRVYLLCEVQISRALPSFIVDYAADRAMPRATTWLKPFMEDVAQQWLN